MTIDEFLAIIDHKLPPAPPAQLAALEKKVGLSLPDDYRRFLIACNGGYVGGKVWFKGPTPEGKTADAGVHHIGGFREEWHFSLAANSECYKDRIPKVLLWVMDDPFGNAICVGLSGKHKGCVYFWDHENEPDDEEWDGEIETAGNLQLLANTFTEFVSGLQPN